MWPVLIGGAVFMAYLCIGLFFVSIPLAVLTIAVGLLVGVGIAVLATAMVLLGGDDDNVLYRPDDHVRAVGVDRPVPVDDAWVVYFAAQAWRDALAITRWTLRLYVGLTLGARERLRRREFGLGAIVLSLPLTVPVAVGWLVVPIAAALTLAVGWAAGAVVTGLVWLGGCTAIGVTNVRDAAWRRRYRAAAACPRCYHVAATPAYRCPGPHGDAADGLHFDLRPGRQGVRWRRCGCGERLPIGARRARAARLHPYCPLCRHRLHPDVAVSTDLRIAVLGAHSAGKTSLLAATICDLADRFAAEGTRFAPGNRASLTRIEKLRADFLAGRPATATDPAPRPTGLLLHVVRGRRRTLLQFLDVSGPGADPAFVEYARALLLVVDPFGMETVRTEARRLRPDLLEYAHAATYPPEQSYQDLAIPLRNTSVADRQRLAVVVTKTDLLVELPVGRDLGHTSDEIRAWLVAQREDNLVLAAVRDFGRVRFFRCSGVTGGESPVEAVRWLLSAEPFALPAGGPR